MGEGAGRFIEIGAKKNRGLFAKSGEHVAEWELHFLIVAACFGRLPPSSGIGEK